MTAIYEWAISPVGSPIIGLVGFVITILGVPLTIWGLCLTYLQAKKAKSAAEAAAAAVNDFRLKIDRYSAYRDIGEATLAIENTRRHINNGAWADACDSYEIALRAITKVQQSTLIFEGSITDGLSQMIGHMTKFCDRIDAARAGKGSYPDKAKVLSMIRYNHAILSAATTAVEKEV